MTRPVLSLEIQDPLSPHALSHVMTELLESYVPTDEGEIANDLRVAGYRQNERDQIMRAWLDHWRSVVQCSACGQPATHMWGAFNEEEGTFSSMAGEGLLSPSCDGCAGRLPDQMIVQAPLDGTNALNSPKSPLTRTLGGKAVENMDRLRRLLDDFDKRQAERGRPFRTTSGVPDTDTSPVVVRVQRALVWIANLNEVEFGPRSGLDAQVPTPSQLANAFALDEATKVYDAVVKASQTDSTAARAAVVNAIVALCRTISDNPVIGSPTGFPYDTALLGVLQDVLEWDR